MCFVLLGCIWDRLVALRNSVKNGPNKCKSSCHEVASEFFATNAPDPPHWTLNRCFGMSHIIWVHLGPFGCLTQFGAKQAELVQKFVTRSRVGIFRNEHSRSTPLDPKLTFLLRFVLFECIWDCLVALRNSVQNGLNKCKSSCHEVASEFFARNTSGPLHWTLN